MALWARSSTLVVRVSVNDDLRLVFRGCLPTRTDAHGVSLARLTRQGRWMRGGGFKFATMQHHSMHFTEGIVGVNPEHAQQRSRMCPTLAAV